MCLNNIMDIFPASCATIINNGGIGAFSSRIQSFDFIDLAESALKALERISIEQSRSILDQANLDIIMNMMDFFEVNTQRTILKIVSNVCQAINSEEDFNKVNLFVPPLVQLFEAWNSSESFDLISSSIKKICESPLRFFDGYNNLDKVK